MLPDDPDALDSGVRSGLAGDTAVGAAQGADEPGEALRVLIVDDSENDVMLARALLSTHPRWRFELSHCNDAEAAERRAIRGRGRYDVVLHGLRDEPYRDRNHLRHMIAALGGCPLVVSGEFWDESQVETLVELGVQGILPKTAWTEETLPHTLMLAAAQGRRQRTFGHDILTGLPTRAVWGERLHHALERCTRRGTLFAVMLVDVDDFKGVNDTLGHEAGDVYLQELGDRLRGALRHEDTVARLGGDEFALLVEDLPYAEAALSVAQKVIERVCEPVSLSRACVPVSVSIGVAIVSAQQRRLTSDWVYQAADAALYEAKRAGKNRYSVYTEDMDRALMESLQIEDDLSRAAENGDFLLFYQPIVRPGDRTLLGFEALMRWDSGGRRPLSPAVFVPILERLGLMDQLGRTIFDEAIAQLGRWRRASGAELVMHLNLSAVQLIDHGLGRQLQAALDLHRVPPSAIVLEFTEGVLLRHGEGVDRELRGLRQRGLRMAIDDFGTGYNTFLSLRQMRPEIIKIDRAFVRQLESSRVDGAIVRAQSVLARALGMQLVAEGVETAQQLAALRDAAQVDAVQGFLTGRPGSVTTVEEAYPALASGTAASGHLRPISVARRRPTLGDGTAADD